VNEIMMEFTESILKIKQSNYNRSLFYTGCVDYMRHMSSEQGLVASLDLIQFKCTKYFRDDLTLVLKKNIS
jgi:hypothetical protein